MQKRTQIVYVRRSKRRNKEAYFEHASEILFAAIKYMTCSSYYSSTLFLGTSSFPECSSYRSVSCNFEPFESNVWYSARQLVTPSGCKIGSSRYQQSRRALAAIVRIWRRLSDAHRYRAQDCAETRCFHLSCELLLLRLLIKNRK